MQYPTKCFVILLYFFTGQENDGVEQSSTHELTGDDCDLCVSRNLLEIITDIAGRVRHKSKLVQHLEVINTMQTYSYINIYKSSKTPDMRMADEE